MLVDASIVFGEGPIMNVLFTRLERLKNIKKHKMMIASNTPNGNRYHEIHLPYAEESWMWFNYIGGLCFNAQLSVLENPILTEEALESASDYGYKNMTLMKLLFLRYHLSKGKNSGDLNFTWPIGQVDRHTGYSLDSERWELLDFLIKDLTYIIDHNELRELQNV